jgi:hypothetical protein
MPSFMDSYIGSPFLIKRSHNAIAFREFIAFDNRYSHLTTCYHRPAIIANRKNKGDEHEYRVKEREVREDTHIPPNDKVIFLEVTVRDPSEFADIMKIHGVEIGKYRVLRADSTAVPNAIAAFLLYVRERTNKIPHAYFGWAEGNPVHYLLRFILFGEGDIAPVTREVLRQAEHNPARRPAIHVEG